jgi:hypothetical protein
MQATAFKDAYFIFQSGTVEYLKSVKLFPLDSLGGAPDTE